MPKDWASHWSDHQANGADAIPVDLHVTVFLEDEAVVAGDGARIITVTRELANTYLVDAQASVKDPSSSGGPIRIQIANVTQSVDMLDSLIEIDDGDTSSYTAGSPSEVEADDSQVALADQISIDIDDEGSGAMGMQVFLTFVGRKKRT